MGILIFLTFLVEYRFFENQLFSTQGIATGYASLG